MFEKIQPVTLELIRSNSSVYVLCLNIISNLPQTSTSGHSLMCKQNYISKSERVQSTKKEEFRNSVLIRVLIFLQNFSQFWQMVTRTPMVTSYTSILHVNNIYYSCGLSTATIEYSCLSECLSVCVHDNSKDNGSIDLKLEHIVVYENSSDEFDIGHCPIKVKVTA